MINPDTGRVHTNYAQAVAVTGRLASNEPNLQNIPIRTAEGPASARRSSPAQAHLREQIEILSKLVIEVGLRPK